jgi:hypothetical protein
MPIDLCFTKFHFVEGTQVRTLRPRRTRQEIQNLLSAFEKSNLTITDFCKAENLSYGVFQKWRSRYGATQRRKGTSSSFTKVDIVPAKKDPIPGLFAEVHGIKIYQPVSASFLKELLA